MTDRDFADIIGATKAVVLSAVEKHLAGRFYNSIDDVVQETYLRAYRSLAKNAFRGESKIQTWLFTIARNESLRMNRILEREEQKIKKTGENYQAVNIQGEAPDGNIQELLEKITILPDKYRSVLHLLSQGYSEKQIALTLGLKSGTVKSRIYRGREMLMKIYQGERS
jgi:RNA polymerase sigma-70 factor (ECF subfamily)